jgi:4-hydroxy-3-methylbut-2-enyl diphosphate reductase
MKRKVILAKTAGFCFGVQRAVETVYQQVEKGEGPIYTYGPIIHNEEVVRDLREKGVGVLDSLEDLEKAEKGTVVIRSHGVAEAVYQKLEEAGMTCVDATCPFVKKIHKIVAQASRKGQSILVVGNDRHPEVEGIKGWAKTPVYVVKNREEAEKLNLPREEDFCIVSQTTFNYNNFKELVAIFSERGYNIYVYNTICNATQDRQKEARQLAKQVEAMIVIGGKASSNTQKLYEICKEECENTCYIQTLDDLNLQSMGSIGCVGITAGASTPKKIIEEVLLECQN